MAVYRLYTGGSDTYQGWNTSSQTPYDSRAIDTIKDPNGAASNREITSIPSPFARIELVKTAFQEVCAMAAGLQDDALRQELSGSTIYHKMVSDSLDVGEIFFNYNKLKDKIDIIQWKLPTPNHKAEYGRRCYDNALSTFWQADGGTYNFNLCKGIYILNYKAGSKPMNIIGATSPATLFFSNANKLDFVNDIKFGQDIPFDNIYQPLYKRDAAYIEMLWRMKSTMPNFAVLFPEVNQYLDLTFQAIEDDTLKNALRNLSPQSTNTAPISVQAFQVEILGQPLCQKIAQPVATSDFMIKSIRQPKCNHLVLPVEIGNTYASWQYTSDRWGDNNKAPYFDPLPIDQRKLPCDGTKQPYLTISDFLSDTLLCSTCQLNNKLFLDGAYKDDTTWDDIAPLLPLTPLFFEYFSAQDLVSGEMLSMDRSPVGGGVTVTLRIPVKKGIVEYSRIYSAPKPNAKKNDGHLAVTSDIEMSVMPAVATPNNVDPLYTFAATKPFNQNLRLEFFDQGKLLSTQGNALRRNSQDKGVPVIDVYTLANRWECVRIITNDGQGMAVAQLPQEASSDSVTFAVDLGTSNTHIEYMVNGDANNSRPMEWSNGMIGHLFLPRVITLGGKTVEDGLEMVRGSIERDILPVVVSSTEAYHFPTRTALSYAANMDWNKQTHPFELSNICLPYAKKPPLSYNKYDTQIKWNDNAGAQSQMEHYIACLVRMMRDKVLCLGGDLGKTNLVWFYPTSMSGHKLGMFQQQWDKAFRSVFGPNGRITCISESQAPVLHHTRTQPTAKDMLSIDIGGGTTDMAFASDGKVSCVTSFRFAAGSLFEDPLHASNRNGIIDWFGPKYETLLQDINDLPAILASVKNNPIEMANTLFGLGDMPCVRQSEKDASKLDFIGILNNDSKFKLEFVLFYAAIIWHAGKMIKAKDLSLPRHIAFSGNGSHLLGVLAGKSKSGLKILQDFSREVLQLASGKEYEKKQKLEIIGFGGNDNPKAVTCKGGLIAKEDDEEPKTEVLLCATEKLAGGLTYGDVDDAYLDKVVGKVKAFIKAMQELDKTMSFSDNFGVADESWETLKETMSSPDDIKTYIRKSIEMRGEKSTTPIAETFFFYALRSILQQYSLTITQQ